MSAPARRREGSAFLSLGPIFFALVTATVLFFAWTKRDEGLLRADQGAGYWMGIAGTVIMVVLFTYPLRKRFPSLAFVGRVSTWFRLHMVLGIIGPSMIMLHSNFRLGPINSELAFVSMLVVVASGIVGRYLYAHMHNGLYGSRIEISSLAAQIEALASDIRQRLPRSPAVTALFDVPIAKRSAWGVRRLRRRVRADLQKGAWIDPATGVPLSSDARATQLRRLDETLRQLADAMAKANRFRRYEWLLGVWHLLHVPLLVLLFFTVVLHIVAVELY